MSYTKLRTKLAEGLKTAYKLSEDDIVTILPEKEDDFKEDEFLTHFLAKDKERIETINLKGKEKFEQGYSKAKKEERSAFEQEIKQHFNIDDDDLIGLELVKKVAESNSKKDNSDPSKLTEDQLKAHPAVIKMLSEREKAFKQEKEKIESDFNSKLNAFNRDKVFNSVSKKALSIFEAMNPVLSTDPVKAQNQKNILLDRIKNYDYQEDENDFIPLKEGKRLEDGHGHGISFESLVKEQAKQLFDFKQADPRENPDPPGDGGGGSTRKPKNAEEYAKMVTDRSIPLEERQKIKEEWSKQE